MQVLLPGQKRWQYLTSRALKLPPGEQQVLTMGGPVKFVVEEKKSLKQELVASPIEAAAQEGIAAYEKSDFSKAKKLLERANTRCERAKGMSQPCGNLSGELSYYLGRVAEEQSNEAEAATEYQRLADSAAHGRLSSQQLQEASSALQRLSRQLGMVLVKSQEKGRCREKKIWLPPGEARIKVDKQSVMTTVKMQQTVVAGSCE
jgi:tetratricopeptide (TPR) repeat protein